MWVLLLAEHTWKRRKGRHQGRNELVGMFRHASALTSTNKRQGLMYIKHRMFSWDLSYFYLKQTFKRHATQHGNSGHAINATFALAIACCPFCVVKKFDGHIVILLKTSLLNSYSNMIMGDGSWSTRTITLSGTLPTQNWQRFIKRCQGLPRKHVSSLAFSVFVVKFQLPTWTWLTVFLEFATPVLACVVGAARVVPASSQTQT